MWFVDYLGRRGDKATPTRFRERSGSDSKRPSQAGMECDPEHHEVYNDSFTSVSIPFCFRSSPDSIPAQTLCVRFHSTDTSHIFLGTDEVT